MTPKNTGNPKEPRDVQSSIGDYLAHRVDARRYLTKFCDLVEGEEIPGDLLMFLQDSFLTYLKGRANSVDQALGLTRSRRGRPGSDFHDRRLMARDVLKTRVAESDHQKALEIVAKMHGCGETKVGEAWAELKGLALEALHVLRSLNGQGRFTDDEWERVREVYKNNPEILKKWPRDGDY